MAEKANNTRIFRTAVLGGYQKNDVEEYIGSLTEEVEKFCTERTSFGERLKEKDDEIAHLNDRLNEMQQQLEKLKRQKTDNFEQERKQLQEEAHSSRAECARLNAEIAKIKEKNSDLLHKLDEMADKPADENEEKNKELSRKLEEQIEVYEKRSAAITNTLTDARVRADQVLEDANSQAVSMIKQAEESVRIQKRAGDMQAQKEAQKYVEQLAAMKLTMQEYLDMLDEIHKGIDSVYGSLSKTAASIPTNVDAFRNLVEKCIDEEENNKIKLLT